MLTKEEIKVCLKAVDKGSRFDEQGKTDKALENWIPVWKKIVEEDRKMGEKRFLGCFPKDMDLHARVAMMNWIDDLRMAFLNSGRYKVEERAEFYQVMLEEFGDALEISTLEYKKDMAEFYYVQDKKAEGDALMEDILSEESDIYTWGAYARAQVNNDDFEKAYQIYLRGIEDVLKEKKAQEQQENDDLYQSHYYKDISLLYEELEELCTYMGKTEEAESWKETRENYLAAYKEVEPYLAKDDIFMPVQMPIVREEPKIGRNDPCPCGSGKKYKKCCLGKE